jgi:hypothetical protein
VLAGMRRQQIEQLPDRPEAVNARPGECSLSRQTWVPVIMRQRQRWRREIAEPSPGSQLTRVDTLQEKNAP